MEDWIVAVRIDGQETERHTVDAPRLTFGRAQDNDVRVRRLGVAPRHVEVYRRGDSLWVKNASEGPGSSIDGERLDQPAQLSPGAVIELTSSVALVIDGGVAQTCPKCLRETADAAWICVHCEYVIDPTRLVSPEPWRTSEHDTSFGLRPEPAAKGQCVLRLAKDTTAEFIDERRTVFERSRHHVIALQALGEALYVEEHAFEWKRRKPHAGREAPAGADLSIDALGHAPAGKLIGEAWPMAARAALGYPSVSAVSGTAEHCLIAAEGCLIARDEAGVEVGRAELELRSREAEAVDIVVDGDDAFTLANAAHPMGRIVDLRDPKRMAVRGRVDLKDVSGELVTQWVDRGTGRWRMLLRAEQDTSIVEAPLEDLASWRQIALEGIVPVALTATSPAWAIGVDGDVGRLMLETDKGFEPVADIEFPIDADLPRTVAAIARNANHLLAIAGHTAYLVDLTVQPIAVAAHAPLEIDASDTTFCVPRMAVW